MMSFYLTYLHPTPDEPDYNEMDHLFIHPQECIDCGACESACPVSAIFEESVVPAEWQAYITINADFFTGRSSYRRIIVSLKEG